MNLSASASLKHAELLQEMDNSAKEFLQFLDDLEGPRARRQASPEAGLEIKDGDDQTTKVEGRSRAGPVPWCSGYHVCLTRRRSPVQFWPESNFLC